MEKLQTYFTNIQNRFWGLLKKAKKNSQENLSEDSSSKSDKLLLIDKNYYSSINELPLKNWIECTSGNLKYCRRNTKKGDQKKDEKYWEMIYDNYIKEQVLCKIFNKMLETMVLLAQAELEFIISGNRFELTQAEMHEAKLKTMLDNKGVGITIPQTLIHLSKWIGSWVNVEQITTKEYFDLLGEFEKHSKSISNGKKDK